MDKRLFLIDGSAQMYRAHFAFIRNPLKTSRGEMTSAIFGFMNMLLSLIEKEQPTHLAIVFDTPEPTFRHKAYEPYKATRQKMDDNLVKQIPRLNQVLAATGIPIITRPGWEADDVIGTLAKQAEREGFDVFMVTGDKDYQQLVSEHIKMWNASKDEITVLDPKGVEEHFGVPPEKVVDVLAIMGDSSDNVPGVKGIGDKGAIKLILEYGSLEKVLEAAEGMKPSKIREVLLRDRDQAILSKELVTIDLNAPIRFHEGEFHFKSIGNPELARLLTDLELFSLLKRLGISAPKPQENVEITNLRNYRLISDAQELLALATLWKRGRPMLSMDVETTSIEPTKAELVGASFSTCEDEAYFISMDALQGSVPNPRIFQRFGQPVTGGTALFLSIMAEVYEDPQIPKTGQNLKYDALVLKTYGIEVAGIAFDTILAAYLLNPGSRSLSIDALAHEYLQLPKIPTEDLIGSGKSQLSMLEVPLEQITEYACEDADYALRLTHVLEPRLGSQEKILTDIELPLLPVLLEMEFNGVRLDLELLNQMSKALDRDMTRLVEECYNIAGEEFNLNSPKQLAAILFDKLRLPVQKKLKSGPSTDVDTLTALASMHELPAKLLEYRMLSKLKGTYVDALPQLIHPLTGRVHTTFSQTVAATGRLSSSNPNLQNIPIRTEIGRHIREAFIPGQKDWQLLSADYSQIELRIMAHLSHDEKLMSAFRKGGDIHRETAALVFGIAPDQVDTDMRRAAKTVNFGIIYGQTDFGLAQELGIPQHAAREFRENYFRLYPGVAEFMKSVIASCRATGSVETMLGRLRRIPDIKNENRQLREFAERTAINTPVQGSAADMIKLAMIAIFRRLKEEKFASRMLLQVHDELLFEAPQQEIERLTNLVKTEMQNALPLSVPVEVEIGIGKNWLEAH
jgi:DNA polymerase I